MGKIEELQHLPQEQIGENPDSVLVCQRCSIGLKRLVKEFNFKCIFILILSVSVFLSAIFWILPFHSTKYGFDAKESIKLSATVQIYFRLQKPVSLLVPHIERLEYEIYDEIGLPNTKVDILSMHGYGASNYTDVVFGILSAPMNVPLNPVTLSVLRSSLVELFLQQINLTVTTTIFGQPSWFEVLKFPGGITENFAEFKEQLKCGLHLRSYENVYVQITNHIGSTIDPPVIVEASVMSDLGSLLPQRLKQLAQIITRSSPAKNLGLNNTVFGKVKGISLSSYLKGTLHATPPTPAPAPSPLLNEYAEPSASPYAAPPSHSLAPSPDFPCSPPSVNCYATPSPDNRFPHAPSPRSEPDHSFPPIANSPAPSMRIAQPPRPCPNGGSIVSPGSSPAPHVDLIVPSASPSHAATPYSSPGGSSSHLSPNLSPLPAVSYGSSPGQDKGSGKGLVSPSLAPSSSALSQTSFAVRTSYKEMWILVFSGPVIFHLLCWIL